MIYIRGLFVLLALLLAPFNINLLMAAEYYCETVFRDKSRGDPLYLTLNGERASTKQYKYRSEWRKLSLPTGLVFRNVFIYARYEASALNGFGLLVVPEPNKNGALSGKILITKQTLVMGIEPFQEAKCELVK